MEEFGGGGWEICSADGHPYLSPEGVKKELKVAGIGSWIYEGKGVWASVKGSFVDIREMTSEQKDEFGITALLEEQAQIRSKKGEGHLSAI